MQIKFSSIIKFQNWLKFGILDKSKFYFCIESNKTANWERVTVKMIIYKRKKSENTSLFTHFIAFIFFVALTE